MLNGDERPIPPLGEGNIRIIPLGGTEEIGRNMTMIEYGPDIIIVDCGFQFREDDTPGIDYILPNTKYLEERREKIRGLFITHGHLDHIGGIPYVIDRIGYPQVFTRKLTAVMIRKRQEEFPNLKPLDIHEVEKEDTIKVGNLRVRFFEVTPSGRLMNRFSADIQQLDVELASRGMRFTQGATAAVAALTRSSESASSRVTPKLMPARRPGTPSRPSYRPPAATVGPKPSTFASQMKPV